MANYSLKNPQQPLDDKAIVVSRDQVPMSIELTIKDLKDQIAQLDLQMTLWAADYQQNIDSAKAKQQQLQQQIADITSALS